MLFVRSGVGHVSELQNTSLPAATSSGSTNSRNDHDPSTPASSVRLLEEEEGADDAKWRVPPPYFVWEPTQR